MTLITKVEHKNPKEPKRVDIDTTRSGNMARDGYKVLDRAGGNSPYPSSAPEKVRRGLSDPVYTGPQQTPDDF